MIVQLTSIDIEACRSPLEVHVVEKQRDGQLTEALRRPNLHIIDAEFIERYPGLLDQHGIRGNKVLVVSYELNHASLCCVLMATLVLVGAASVAVGLVMHSIEAGLQCAATFVGFVSCVEAVLFWLFL